MSDDDLVKRLRVCAAFDPDQAEAANRIEKLERDILNYSSAVADAQMRNEELDRALNRIIDRWEAQKARIEKLEAGEIEFDRIIGDYASENARFRDRIEKLEAALDDALQYISRADWHYLKDETRKALEGEDD